MPVMMLTAIETGTIHPAGGFKKSSSFLTNLIPPIINIEINFYKTR